MRIALGRDISESPPVTTVRLALPGTVHTVTDPPYHTVTDSPHDSRTFNVVTSIMISDTISLTTTTVAVPPLALHWVSDLRTRLDYLEY